MTESSSARSGSGNGHALEEHGRRVDAVAEDEVARRLEAQKHVFQIAGHGDLAHRMGKGAVFDPEAGCAPAVVAGDAVDAHADEVGDIEPLAEAGDHGLGAARTRLEVEIRCRGRGRAAGAAYGM